jgi:hypothetical protein
MRFQFLTAVNMKMRAFWDIASCRLVGVVRRFRGAFCLHRQMMEAVCTSETSVYYNQTTWRKIPKGYHLHPEYCQSRMAAKVDRKVLFLFMLMAWDYLWTATTKGPTVRPSHYIWVWRSKVEWYWRKPCSIATCPQVPHRLTGTRTSASAVGGQRLTSWAMTQSKWW